MSGTDLTGVLEDAGLSPYQADALLTILELGSASATDIAQASSVPDPRIYDVLRSLEERGFIETYEQDSLHARIHNPETILEDLQTRAKRFNDAADEIERLWEKPKMDSSSVSIVTRFETVVENASDAIREAAYQVQLSISVDQYEQLRPALKEATENGVNVKLSIHTDNGSVDALPDREDVAGVCSEARHRRLPSPFLAIVDWTQTFFSPHPSSADEYGVLIEDKIHTYVFHWFFLTTLWDVWDVYYTESTDDLPRDFIDIRYCIQVVEPLLEEGRAVTVQIDGIDTETGAERTVEGTVTDIIVTDTGESDRTSVANFGGQAGIVVETAGGTVDVGGWGAMIEDVEALRIRVTSVESSPSAALD